MILVGKLLIFLIALAATSGHGCLDANATSGWELLSTTDHLHAPSYLAAHYFDETRGIALTPLFLQATEDGGKTWETIEAPEGVGLRSMKFADSKTGWIVGTAVDEASGEGASVKRTPVVLHSSNGGESWARMSLRGTDTYNANSFTEFTGVCPLSKERLLLVGDAGIAEVTVNSQELRLTSFQSSRAPLTSSWCYGGDVWAAGEQGVVMHKVGTVWSTIQFNEEIAFKRIQVTEKAVWIVGFSRPSEVQVGAPLQIKGVLFKSGDSGITWNDVTPTASEGLSDVFFIGDKGWLAGRGGAIYTSIDSGSSWHQNRRATSNDLYAIVGLDGHHIFIMGDKLTVLRSRR